MANTASQKDLLDTIWHFTRGFIGQELLSERKLVPVPYLSNADDFGLFSVFVKSKPENVSQKIKHSLAGACYHVIGHVSKVTELEKTDLDRLLNSAKPHTEDVGNQSVKWEKDVDLGCKSVHLTIEGLHKFLIPLNLSEGDLCLEQNIPDLVGAKSVYIITDVMKASRVTACVTSHDGTMERVSAVSVPIGFGYSKFRLTPEGLVAEQMKCEPAIHGKWVVVLNQLSVSLHRPPRKQPVIPEKPVTPEEVLPAKNLPVVAEKHSTHLDSPTQGGPEKEFLVRNQYEDNETSSALTNSRRPYLDDVKLKLDCRVVIEGLPKHFTVSGTNVTCSKTHTKKRVKGKSRLLCISDTESEGEEILENDNHHPKNPPVKAESKGKQLKNVINLEEPTSSLDDYSDEDGVIEPLTLNNPPRGRLTLATAGTSARRESENQSEPEETEDQRKKPAVSNVVTPRTAKIIPIRPQVSRKKKQISSIASLREKMCKDQGMESYVRCVHDATKKTDDRPSTSSLPIQVSRKKISPPKRVSKVPKSSTLNSVKAKVTKKSRGDMFLKDLVGEEQMSKEGAKKGPTSALSGFCIPKLSKSTVESSSNGQEASSSSGASAQKRKHPDHDEDRLNQAEANAVDESTSVSYAFKKPQKRVARQNNSCDDDDRNGGSLSSKFPNRRHDRPRDEALPLGRNKKWGPPNGIKNVPREDVASRHAGNREPTPHSGAQDNQQSNHEEVGSSAQHDETIQLPMPDCEKRIRSLSLSASENGNHGILRYHGWNNVSKRRKKVSIVEENNKIYEIEARAPTPPLPLRTPVRSIDHTALTHDILYRICCWNYNWIAQQKLQQQQKNDEPPPLLAAANRGNGQSLPALSLLPVVSAYDSLEAYCTIFQSLMFHETWAILCKDMESRPSTPIRVLVCSIPKFCNGFAILQCEAFSATRINEKDLVAITVPIAPQKPPAKYFGVVDQLVLRNWRKEDTDPRLLEPCKPPNDPYMKMSFVLLVKFSNVPKELDKIDTITKITCLSTVLKQFILNADLSRSPLCDVILHPSDFSDAFKLDTVDIEGKNDLLNPVQYKAVESITKTIVCASDREPKVALLQSPPGTGKSHVIVELISRMLDTHYEKTNKYPRILVCAPSNNAVDEIAARLMHVRDARKSNYHIVRVGVTTSMHPSVAKISLEELIKKHQQTIMETKESLESCKLRTLTEEHSLLKNNKTCLIASIDAANKNGQSDEARMYARKLEQLEGQIEGVDRSLNECMKNHYNNFNTERMRSAFKKDVISGSQVIFSTLNSCRSREMENLFVQNRRGTAFLCCIIDEASQCTEPESVTPLVFGISKLVLIGDPDQLPATVTSPYAARNRFDQSLFNRFYSSRLSTNSEDEEGVLMLDTQYRMAAKC